MWKLGTFFWGSSSPYSSWQPKLIHSFFSWVGHLANTQEQTRFKIDRLDLYIKFPLWTTKLVHRHIRRVVSWFFQNACVNCLCTNFSSASAQNACVNCLQCDVTVGHDAIEMEDAANRRVVSWFFQNQADICIRQLLPLFRNTRCFWSVHWNYSMFYCLYIKNFLYWVSQNKKNV